MENGRGLSSELAEKYPHMRVIHYCAGAEVVCELKLRDIAGGSDNCEQLIESIATSSFFNGRWQVIKLNPEPSLKCADCQVNKTSSVVQGQ